MRRRRQSAEQPCVAEGGEPCLTAGERSVTRGWRNLSINRPQRGRTRAHPASQRVATDSPTTSYSPTTRLVTDPFFLASACKNKRIFLSLQRYEVLKFSLNNVKLQAKTKNIASLSKGYNFQGRRPTSTTTRIETRKCSYGFLSRCRRPTSTTTRIETFPRRYTLSISRGRRPTSTTTRIETGKKGIFCKLLKMVADLHPLQQGLRHSHPQQDGLKDFVADLHPLQQGLRL